MRYEERGEEVDSCENTNIWIELDNIVFVKSSSAYYFVDLDLIKFFYVANSRVAFNLTFEVRLMSPHDGELDRRNISDTTLIDVSYEYSIGNYMTRIVEIKYELNEAQMKKWTELDMFLDVYSTRSKTDESLHVQMKRSGRKALTSDASLKKSAILCSKCFFLNSDNDYRNFEWWLQINRMIGYEKVSFCESSIDLSYFGEHVDLIETQTLKCIPDFISSRKGKKSKYFHSFLDLKYKGVFSYASTDIFNVIITNDCYLRNIEK